MTDQLDDLFRDLRAETLTTVRPPGVAAARRTLRRRRRNRAAGVVVCLAAAGVGGVGAHLLGPAPEPGTSDRADRAAAAVGAAPAARFSGQGAAGSAVVASGVLLSGHYVLALACVGSGAVTMTVRVGGAELARSAARCRDGRTSRTVFTMPDPLTATAELTADDDADGQAGYAYALTPIEGDRDERTTAAVASFSTGRGPVVSWLSSPSIGPMTTTTKLEAGRYYLRYTCVGAGRGEFTLRLPDPVRVPGQPCDQNLPPRTVGFDMARSGLLSVEVSPGAGTEGTSSWAVRVERR